MSTPRKDSRDFLNLVLRAFYDRRGSMHVLTEVREGRLRISRSDAMAVYHTLLKDGHIRHLFAHDARFFGIPLASITAQGQVFLEQGGYRDESTVFERLVKRAKNHPILAWIIISFMVLAAMVGVFGVVLEGIDFFRAK